MCPAICIKIELQTKNLQPETTSSTEHNFSGNPEVLLQTLRVKLRGERTNYEVRAIVDNGSQRSYVLKNAVNKMGYSPVGQQKLTHSLFGGAKSKEQNHYRYQMRLSSLDGKYACKFEALENETICNGISSVRVGPWTEELRGLNIELSDTIDSTEPIQVLIGADVAGKLMTGRFHILKSGPVAVETLLGWTLMGKLPVDSKRTDAALTVTSMYSMDARVADLWELDNLGILDPACKKTREERDKETKDNFLRTVCVNAEGCYEVELPWIMKIIRRFYLIGAYHRDDWNRQRRI